MVNLKKIMAAAAIAGAFGFTALGLGPGMVNAVPTSPVTPETTWPQDNDCWWGHCHGHGHGHGETAGADQGTARGTATARVAARGTATALASARASAPPSLGIRHRQRLHLSATHRDAGAERGQPRQRSCVGRRRPAVASPDEVLRGADRRRARAALLVGGHRRRRADREVVGIVVAFKTYESSAERIAKRDAALAARADQQHRFVMQGDDRGLYGPQGPELMHYIHLGEPLPAPTVEPPVTRWRMGPAAYLVCRGMSAYDVSNR